jgi:hypothetical protein
LFGCNPRCNRVAFNPNTSDETEWTPSFVRGPYRGGIEGTNALPLHVPGPDGTFENYA